MKNNIEALQIQDYLLVFESISVYRALLNNETLNNLYLLINSLASDSSDNTLTPSTRDRSDLLNFITCYNDFYFSLLNCNSTKSLMEYIYDLAIYDENEFSKLAETKVLSEINPLLLSAVESDLEALKLLGSITSEAIIKAAIESFATTTLEKNILKKLPSWDFVSNANSKSLLLETAIIATYYKANGTGIFSKFNGFVWEPNNGTKLLKGVESPDPITFKNLSGYEFERSVVVKNTVHFLNGHFANNVLLYGDRGTGKSSTVKACLNEYASKGLRLIEIPKMYLTDFPEILRLVKGRPQKFIFFIDDLAFEDNEESYTAMKAILEGGIETRPDNVVIYATTNRRHLIKEKFTDRSGLTGTAQEEIHALDTIQEKLSLADRFGITVTFSAPDKFQYLSIVEAISEERGLNIEKERLHREALQWEIRYNGRSPRTAHQFIDWLEGELA